jgi:hypothetical protein
MSAWEHKYNSQALFFFLHAAWLLYRRPGAEWTIG